MQDDFQMEVLSNVTFNKHSIKAVNLKEGYEMKRTEALNAMMVLKFFIESAYLNPGNFSDDEQKHKIGL